MTRKTKHTQTDPAITDMANTLSQPAARRILWDILGECGLYDTAPTDTNQMLVHSGKRAIGLYILQRMEEADPRAYAKMILEQQGANNGPSNDTDTDTDSGAADDFSRDTYVYDRDPALIVYGAG